MNVKNVSSKQLLGFTLGNINASVTVFVHCFGFISGGLQAAFGLSPELFSLLVLAPMSPSLAAVLLLTVTAIAAFAGILGLRLRHAPSSHAPLTSDVRTLTTDAFEYAPSDANSSAGDSDDGSTDTERIICTDPPTTPPPPPQQRSVREGSGQFWTSALNLRFAALALAFALGSSAALNLLWTLSASLSLVGCSRRRLVCSASFAAANCLSSLGVGFVSDRLAGRLPRINFLIVAFLSFLISGAFVIVYVDVCDAWLVLSLCAGITYGCLWCLVPTLLAENFGFRCFTPLWSSALVLSVVCTVSCSDYLLHVFPGSDKYSFAQTSLGIYLVLGICASICSVFVVRLDASFTTDTD